MNKKLAFLSDDWLSELSDQVVGLKARSIPSGVFLHVFTSTPHGKVVFKMVIEESQITALDMGNGESDVTVTWRYSDAVDWFTGELDLDVAYMTGRCKLEGDYSRYLFGMRPLFWGEEWMQVLNSLTNRSVF